MGVSDYVTAKRLNQALNLLFIPLVAFIISLKLQEIFKINAVLIVVTVVYLLKNIFLESGSLRSIQLNELDYALLFVVAVELLSFFTSTYRPNSFYSLMEVLFFFLFYNLVRFNLKHQYQRIALFLFITLWGVLLSGVALYYFYILYRQVNLIGFRDITDFRNYIYLLNPTGVSVGEWVTVLFLMLPFPLILFIKFRRSPLARLLMVGAVTAILFSISITFIRGAYMALLAFCALGTGAFYIHRIFPLKKIIVFNSLVLGLLGICLLPVWKPVLTTLSVFKTTSQVRSLEGRKNIWRDSLKIIKAHPLVGVGANNFTMQYLIYKEQGTDTAFALRPFNYFLQILIEKGALGLLAYLLLLFSFYRVSHRKIVLLRNDTFQKSVVVCFMVAYAAIIVRDLSESSILTNRGVNVLLWFMFASNARLEERESL